MKGRALLNAIGNLQLSGPYAEALTKLGYNLEDVANQVFFLLLFSFVVVVSASVRNFYSCYNFCLSNSPPGSM